MKVTLVGTNDRSGGAARAMYRLHLSLLSQGIESRILCLYKSTNDIHSNEIIKYNYPILSHQKFPFLVDLIEENRTPVSNTLFSYTDLHAKIETHPLILDSDVINLHWTNFFLSVKDIGKLLYLNKKIIWTLHDEWAYTGGCHYTSGCNEFLNNCKNCIQVNSNITSLPELLFLEKNNNYSNDIELVAPSNWLAKKAKTSPLFKNSRVHVIANSLESDWFLRFDKGLIRNKFGFSSNCFVVGFGADSIIEKRKGISYLIEAFRILMLDQEWNSAFESKEIVFVFFGNYSDRNIELENFALHLGSFSDDREISEIYQMLDLFVIPSLEDNLPNTMLESMASSTPVLGFPVGGISETICHNENGFLTDSISANSLAKEIYRIWKDISVREKISDMAVRFAQNQFSSGNQAKAYIKLFIPNSEALRYQEEIDFVNKENLRSAINQKLNHIRTAYSRFISKAELKKRILNILFKSKFLNILMQKIISRTK
ncbi:glycosyltransferase [Leptospira biflexa]|uniref:glycosyltransferase n=2 Tax=Leptospira biflexa TaxID=172 RepID=UPI001083AFDA|nr:glycosyltransferase [Leptospira biflexa]TGM39098.1 glycosyltransferase [Leptospira biflexa]